MGQISVKWSWSHKKRKLGKLLMKLGRINPNGFQIDGSLKQMRWVMNNIKGAFFKLEEFESEGTPKALLFIAPDELTLARLVKGM